MRAPLADFVLNLAPLEKILQRHFQQEPYLIPFNQNHRLGRLFLPRFLLPSGFLSRDE